MEGRLDRGGASVIQAASSAQLARKRGTARGSGSGSGGRVVLPAALMGAFLVVWELEVIHSLLSLETFAVPLPSEILDAVLAEPGRLAEGAQETFKAALLGYMLGNGLGVALAAALVALPPWAGGRAAAVFGSLQALPLVAVAPLVALHITDPLWFKTVTVVVLLTPPMLVYAYRGMTRTDPESLELVASYEASRWQTFRLLRLPSAVPEIFVALKYTSVLTLVGVVLCEIIRARDGLGYEIQQSLNAFATGRAWGAVVVLALGGICLYFTVATVERRLVPWSAEDRDA